MHFKVLFYILIALGVIGTHTALQAEMVPSYSYKKAVIDTSPVVETMEDEIATVPFYSQFADISSAKWKKVACGIASLAMLIDYYGESESPDVLLKEGIASGAYNENAGWYHAGLINLAKKRGLNGATISLSHLSMTNAFSELEEVLEVGPVMVSVHYTFDPKNPIPHLVVINDVYDGMVYYNDPAEETGGGSITIEKFKSSWKKRYIELRPAA